MIAYGVLQQVTAILRTLTILFDATSFNLINKCFENIVHYTLYRDNYEFEADSSVPYTFLQYY